MCIHILISIINIHAQLTLSIQLYSQRLLASLQKMNTFTMYNCMRAPPAAHTHGCHLAYGAPTHILYFQNLHTVAKHMQLARTWPPNV